MPTPTESPRPVPYSPDVEHIEPDEQETIRELVDTLREIGQTVHEARGHGMRTVHAKSHGFLVGELRVHEGLAPELAQGLFAQAGTYPVVMRFSSTPGDPLDDSVSLPRGLSIKVIGVPGARVAGSEGDATQDFVMINGPVFLKKDIKGFLRNLKLLEKTTERAEGSKKVFSAMLRGTEKVIEAFGGESGTLKAMGGHPMTHPLGETFFTQAPYRHGDYLAKYSIAPVSPALTALTDTPVEVKGRPDGLREAIVSFFGSQGGEWALRAQLCTDLEAMPIEDASVEWDQALSPYRTVATLSARPQQAWSEELSALVDDRMLFAPWHALEAHRPLGSVMRARKVAYQELARVRARQNGTTLVEPASLDALALPRHA